MSFKTSCIYCFICMVLSTASAQYACLTPSGNRGYCVLPTNCDYYQTLWRYYGTSIPAPALQYIKKSRCIGETTALHICCETYIPPSTAVPTSVQKRPVPRVHVPRTVTPYKVPADYESALNRAGVSILQQQHCGNQSGNRIAGGENASLSEFPWMAILRYNTGRNPYKCGGSVVSNRYVLTAAHCLTTKTGDLRLVAVRLGEHDLNSIQDCIGFGRFKKCAPPAEDYGIIQELMHPSYDASALTFDIGLIKLNRNIVFKKHIQPICLPTTFQSADFADDMRFIVAGWGYTENGSLSAVLQKAWVPYRKLDECQNDFVEFAFSDVHLCAGGEANIDSCKGDSGGPLFGYAPYNQNRSRVVQFGIVSFGRLQCGGGTVLPGVYANVVRLMPWITENIVN